MFLDGEVELILLMTQPLQALREELDGALYRALLQWRGSVATTRCIPPIAVFSNTTLSELARKRCGCII